MAAERRKRAAILESEGERTTLANEAAGRADAIIAEATAKREVERNVVSARQILACL